MKFSQITSMYVAFVFVCILSACSQQANEQPATMTATWNTFVADYIDDYFSHHPAEAVNAGKHEYDGQLADYSPEGIDATIEMFTSYLREAQDFDTAGLSPEQLFEREYLISELEENLFWLEDARWPYKNPSFYRGGLSPDVYISREYAPLEERFAALITYLNNLPAAIDQMQENLSQDSLPETYVQLGLGFFNGLATYFENDVPPIFASVENDSLQQAFSQANARAIQAASDAAAWLNGVEKTKNYAIGADLFQQMLWKTERVDMPLEELRAMGERDLERNLKALQAACNELAPGKSIEACIAQVQANKPPEGPVEGAQRQLSELRQFLIDEDIVTIPGTETCEVAEAPPYRRSNIAYINIPGPYEEGLSSTYYIAPPDPTWTEDEQNQYIPGEAPLLYISVHEVWPGHFLQFLHSNRSEILFGQLFVGYAFAEGWAHYTEEMMQEAGLQRGNPEMHIGQLLNALLRDVRYLSAIGLHTGTMTVEQSEKMFIEYAYQDPGNARQQAARGTFDPGYLNYTLGKLMILQLREDWLAAHPDADMKAFHNQFLSYGGPPIPLIRKEMLGKVEASESGEEAI